MTGKERRAMAGARERGNKVFLRVMKCVNDVTYSDNCVILAGSERNTFVNSKLFLKIKNIRPWEICFI